ncbi:MAG TPA: hypothetical protein PJ997_00235 [Candidatus Paceibacterota bacterium]|nr:hypothetical protein [Candidatus Paceibacterota bacterium]HMP18759.1 hypothetical protein [Candidatus Paceibacterota bacterium]HMP85320.1 hypothetical protein [Candidatus Paceibacterota bacterium]
MFISRNKKISPKLKIVLDFRSASVGGAIVIESKEDRPKVIYTKRHYVETEMSFDQNVFIKKLIKSFDLVLKDIKEIGIKNNSKYQSENSVSEVFCCFSSPWYKLKLKNFNFTQDKKTKFTEKTLKNLLDKNNTEITSKECLIENKILSVSLNDYEISNPFGKYFEKAKISFYEGYISKKLSDLIIKKIEDAFLPKKISLNSHPFVILSVIKNTFPSTDSFVLIDIGGETTDLSLYKNSVLKSVVTFPKGNNFFIRELIKKYKIEQKQIFSEIELFYDKNMNQEAFSEKINFLNSLKDQYISEISKFMEKKWINEITPGIIFLTTDLQISEFTQSILKSKDFYFKTLKINSEPIIHIINQKNIPDLCLYQDDINKDPLISIIANFSNFLDN